MSSPEQASTPSLPWDIAPALEPLSAAKLRPHYSLPAGSAETTVEVLNPATQQPLARLDLVSNAAIPAAIQHSRSAQKHWLSLPLPQRMAILFRAGRLLQERARELAIVSTLATGLPVREAREVDAAQAASAFQYHAGWTDKLPHAFAGSRGEPWGVVLHRSSARHPLLSAAAVVAPALAAGNAAVLLPPPSAGIPVMHLHAALQDAGVPEHLVQVLPADDAAVRWALEHAGADKVILQAQVHVLESLAGLLRGPSLLAAEVRQTIIVLENSAVDQAVEAVILASMTPQPMALGARLLLQESLQDSFTRKLIHRLQRLRVGDPLDRNTEVGPLTSQADAQAFDQALHLSREQGLEVLQGSQQKPGELWRPPTLVLGAAGVSAATGEVPGPLLSVQTFRTPDEAVDKASHVMGQSTVSVWTDKASQAWQLMRALRAGALRVNTCQAFDATASVGPVGGHGWGRLAGVQGLGEMVRFAGGVS